MQAGFIILGSVVAAGLGLAFVLLLYRRWSCDPRIDGQDDGPAGEPEVETSQQEGSRRGEMAHLS